jgi:hypothetical protein
MARFNKKEFLDNLNEENKKIIKNIETNLLPLSKDKLNFKPSPKAWSINEIFQHLILAEMVYLSKLEKLEKIGKTVPEKPIVVLFLVIFSLVCFSLKVLVKLIKFPLQNFLTQLAKKTGKTKILMR